MSELQGTPTDKKAEKENKKKLEKLKKEEEKRKKEEDKKAKEDEKRRKIAEKNAMKGQQSEVPESPKVKNSPAPAQQGQKPATVKTGKRFVRAEVETLGYRFSDQKEDILNIDVEVCSSLIGIQILINLHSGGTRFSITISYT